MPGSFKSPWLGASWNKPYQPHLLFLTTLFVASADIGTLLLMAMVWGRDRYMPSRAYYYPKDEPVLTSPSHLGVHPTSLLLQRGKVQDERET